LKTRSPCSRAPRRISRRADAATRAGLATEIVTARAGSTRLVNNLLDQTRLESGALSRGSIGATPTISSTPPSRRARFARGHPFECDVPDDLPLFSAPTRAHGASHREPPLNGRAAHTRSHADFSDRRRRGRALARVLTVADRGPGFPMEMPRAALQKSNAAMPLVPVASGSGSIIRASSSRKRRYCVGENPAAAPCYCFTFPTSRTVKSSE